MLFKLASGCGIKQFERRSRMSERSRILGIRHRNFKHTALNRKLSWLMAASSLKKIDVGSFFKHLSHFEWIFYEFVVELCWTLFDPRHEKRDIRWNFPGTWSKWCMLKPDTWLEWNKKWHISAKWRETTAESFLYHCKSGGKRRHQFPFSNGAAYWHSIFILKNSVILNLPNTLAVRVNW